MKTAKFNPAGGPLEVELTCDPTRSGSYTIILWEANSNNVVKKYSGNFIEPGDDIYSLDPPNSAHIGRSLEALVVVAVPPGVEPSDVTMTVSQDGSQLAYDMDSVAPGSSGQMVDLSIALAALAV